MELVCALVAGLARAASLTVDPVGPVPTWITEHWEAEAPDILAGFASAYPGPAPGEIVLSAQLRTGTPGQRDLKAVATDGRISIILEGQGWRIDSQSARAQLTQNLAHEVAHHWQFARGGTTYTEPLWWHEGTAEAMATRALVTAKIWGATEVLEWRQGITRRCEDALERGRLNELVAIGDRDAIYGCGAVIVDALRVKSGRSVTEMRDVIDTATSLEQAFRELAGKDMARSVVAFFTRDYRGSPQSFVIESVRAGRL